MLVFEEEHAYKHHVCELLGINRTYKKGRMQNDRVLHLLLEMHDGGSLEDLIANGRFRLLPPSLQLRILCIALRDAAKGLQCVHTLVGFHGDVHPGQMLLSHSIWPMVVKKDWNPEFRGVICDLGSSCTNLYPTARSTSMSAAQSAYITAGFHRVACLEFRDPKELSAAAPTVEVTRVSDLFGFATSVLAVLSGARPRYCECSAKAWTCDCSTHHIVHLMKEGKCPKVVHLRFSPLFVFLCSRSEELAEGLLDLIQRSVTRERSERPKLRQWIETLDAIVDQLGPVQDDLKLVPRELLEDLAVGLPLTADVDGDRDGIAVAPAVESLEPQPVLAEPQPVLAEQQSVLAEQSVPSSESLTASPDERPVQRQQEAPSPSRSTSEPSPVDPPKEVCPAHKKQVNKQPTFGIGFSRRSVALFGAVVGAVILLMRLRRRRLRR